MVVRNNNPAHNSNRNLGINNTNTSRNLEKLSSGFRINRAADDAAGLAISEKMRGQIRGLAMAEMNVDHGVKLVQTAEGGMEEIISMLQRQRELMVQASNGTYSESDREMIQLEINQLNAEITDTARKTHFNNIPLLNNPVGRIDMGQISGPTLNGGVMNPTVVLNYFETDGAQPYQFCFNTRLEVIDSASGNPIGLTYDPVTGAKGLAETDGVDWKKDDIIEFSMGFDVNVNPLTGMWWDFSTPGNYYTIPSTMTPGSTYTPAFTPAPNIPDGGLPSSSPYWQRTTNVPSATVYPDIIIRSPGYPDTEGSFEVVWEGSQGVPASIKCSACGGSPCTCGTIPDGFKDRIKIDPNPTSNFSPLGAQLKITIDGEFLHIGDGADENENGGLNSQTLANYDGLWDVKVVNESPQALNSGSVSYEAHRTFSNILPGHPLWDYPSTFQEPQRPTQSSDPDDPPRLPSGNSYYNVSIDYGSGWPDNREDYTFSLTPRPQTQHVNLSTIPGSHPLASLRVGPISSNPHTTTHHQSYVTGGVAHLDLAVERPDRDLPIQSGANSNEQINLSLYDARAFALGLSDFWGNTQISAATVEEANASIELLDKALNTMVSMRSTAGSEQNRLEHAQKNLGVTKENLTASESTIRDLDMAKEIMEFTKNQILMQSSQSMMAQAQQLPQGILSLLK